MGRGFQSTLQLTKIPTINPMFSRQKETPFPCFRENIWVETDVRQKLRWIKIFTLFLWNVGHRLSYWILQLRILSKQNCYKC